MKRRAVKVWPVGVSFIKGRIIFMVETRNSCRGGLSFRFCHFPQYGDEYFKQLTAEKLVTKQESAGFVVQEWVKTGIETRR